MRCDAHDGRFDLGWRSKVVAANLEHVRDLGEQLSVGRQTTVQLVTRRRQQTQRKLSLEHQQRTSSTSMYQYHEFAFHCFIVGAIVIVICVWCHYHHHHHHHHHHTEREDDVRAA